GGGTVTADGGASVTAAGVCYGTSANPDITGTCTDDGSGTGPFVSNLVGLSIGQLYHVRAYATNSAGTGYGSDTTFTTITIPPTVTTAVITNITTTEATSGGTVTA